ncbi:MAG: Glycosyltransferase [uncultured Cytophagales bacterium]|uniref:Glycosyltransferase n=1 Tax=uncultured Cytophagales bacterium TaxID=158755 RepID=A0A6J4K7K5_9SPHI|nr:MAG: Glycosyltransferase [uncultured Cytophagales bacterium]
MAARYSQFTRIVYLTGDIFLINLSFALAYLLRFGDLAFYHQSPYLVLFLYYNAVWLAVSFTLKVYNISRVAQYSNIALDLLKLLFFHVSLVTAFIVAIKGYDYSRQHLVVTYLLMSASVVAWRLGCVKLFRMFRVAGRNSRRVVIVGVSEIADQLKKFFSINPQYGYQFLGFFDDRATNGEDLRGRVADVKEYVLTNKVDEIYCTMTEVNNRQVNDLLDFAEKNHIHVKVVPDFREINYRKIEIDFYDDFPVLTFREIPLDDVLNQVVKRSFDVLFSMLVIVFVYPWLLPIIALLIKLDSRGPVFFWQERSGRNNQNFWCLKFRSMYVDDGSKFKQATRDDNRITRVGRILRKTNLDEMPQFFNVLLGHMSVVGPRPHPIKLDENFRTIIDRYDERNLVKPGVTGLAQVKGYRGETAHPQLMKNRVRVDLFYIENWTFILDLKIIFLTVSSMMRGDRNAF